MWVVYLLQNKITKEFYIGVTNDLRRRLKEHNANQNKSTRRNKKNSWVLIYAEAYRHKKDAYLREYKLKQRGSAKHHMLRRVKFSRLDTPDSES